MSQQVTRRKFLKSTAAVAGVAAGAKVFAAPAVLSEKSPNSKLGTVVIGVVNQGKPAVVAACTERLIALCDVDDNHNAQAKKFIGEQHPEIKLSAVQEFYDYRKMFDKIHKDIDAVFIAAPDHHHAVASLIAMKLGKHVYCEKPLAHSIGEVRTDDGNGPQVQGHDAVGQPPPQFGERPPAVRVHLGRRDRQRDGDV